MIELPDMVLARWPDGSSRPARGLLVGVIIVRATFPDETTEDDRGYRTSAANRWAVDYGPLRAMRFVDVASFTVALLIADELSRFAKGDFENAQNARELVAAVGDPIGNWVNYVVEVDARHGIHAEPIDYRAWCEVSSLPPPRARACDVRAFQDFDLGVCDGS